ADKDIEDKVRGVLSETSFYITKKHGFEKDVHQTYVDKIISRFKNPNISDDLLRVGRSPLRKISRHDRFVAPALGVIDLGGEPVYLAKAIATAMTIVNEDDPESVELKQYLKEHNVAEALQKYSSLEKNSILSKLVQKEYNSLNN
ncbi:MAG: mannitol-1-phosphate 5-dehydrogenase, partial [Clostridium sp.]|nr:mannitol-1-phosphate 5-dehydrogenase [Clostridium sp.]